MKKELSEVNFRNRSDLKMTFFSVMQMINKAHGLFTEKDEDYLRVFSRLATVALHNSRNFGKMQNEIDLLESKYTRLKKVVETMNSVGDGQLTVSEWCKCLVGTLLE